MRDRHLWLSGLPVAGLFAASRFLAALLLMMPGTAKAVLNRAEALERWKRP